MIKQTNTKWQLGCFFKDENDSDIEIQLKEVEAKNNEFISKWKGREDYLEKAEVLREALDEYEHLANFYNLGGNPGYYFWLRTQQDQNNPVLKAKYNKIEELINKISANLNFFTLRLAKISKEKQEEFLNNSSLEEYKHFLEKLFAESKYLLSEAEEKILTLKSSVAHSNWVKMVSGFISKEEREVLDKEGKLSIKNLSEISSLMKDKDKKVRDSAGRVFNEILEKYSDVAEQELNSILANKKIDDELRGVERPDLTRFISDDIEPEVVDLMSGVVADNFDIAQKYYELKAKLMGVEKLEYHERNVEYGEVDKEYPYEESLETVHRVFGKLDKEFETIIEDFDKNGCIDVYPCKGRHGNAFCVRYSKSQPTFIFLTHNNTLNDVLTLAHELGHGINNILMQKNQNALNFDTPLSTAEVASTFFEDFVLEEVLENADDELRLSILMQKLNDDISTIFRQIACFRFEQELHKEFREKGYLSKEEIGKLFQKYMASYMGDFVEQSAGSENWWVYWGHIRRFFYNYSYANGLLISKSLQKSVKENPEFIGKVKEFLSAGTSDSPKNIFKKLGIDIEQKEFWLNGVNEVKDLLKETEELAKKLGKI